MTDLAAAEVVGALDRLREFVLVWKVTGGRAEKWEHNLEAKWQAGRPEKAMLALLLLRGAQTAAELRARAERMKGLVEIHAVGQQDYDDAVAALQQAEASVAAAKAAAESARINLDYAPIRAPSSAGGC